jgi:hypothetical protein
VPISARLAIAGVVVSVSVAAALVSVFVPVSVAAALVGVFTEGTARIDGGSEDTAQVDSRVLSAGKEILQALGIKTSGAIRSP